MASYEPQHLTVLHRWDNRLPRFLFRGFNEHSGGDKNLNTPEAITPHAFLSNDADMINHKSVKSRPLSKVYPSYPTPLNSMSLERFRSEINAHIEGRKDIASNFSSWTADFTVATRYAWRRHAERHCHDPHIGIFDTSRRDHGNVILHVQALREEGHTTFRKDWEYLVYGPVKGVPYNCLSLSTSLYTPLNLPLYTDPSGLPVMSTPSSQSTINKAFKRATLHSYYHAAGTRHEAHWGYCTDTAVYLAIIAAEWAQDPDSEKDFDTFNSLTSTWTLEDEERANAFVTGLSQVLERAAGDPTLILPLVNPLTHSEGMPNLERVISLLTYMENVITYLRSKKPF